MIALKKDKTLSTAVEIKPVVGIRNRSAGISGPSDHRSRTATNRGRKNWSPARGDDEFGHGQAVAVAVGLDDLHERGEFGRAPSIP